MVSIVYCTRQTNPQHKEHLIKSSGLHKHVEVIEIINNGESLTHAYNRGLKQAKYDIVVFCHDDLTIETKQWGNKLVKLFDKNPEYGIIGVAGSKNMPVSGQWWENRNKMYGRVAHTHEGKTWLSAYSDDLGQNLEEVVVVDGVWFAVHKNRIKKTFNEKVEGFHFYDVTFSFENFLQGVKVGVTTVVRVNHQSIGMTNEAWEKNRADFSETFQAHLPANIKKTIRQGQRLKIMISGFIATQNDEKHIIDIIKSFKGNSDIHLVTNYNINNANKFKKLGVKLYSFEEPPSFKLGDGKWVLKTQNGDIVSKEKTLYKISDVNFDFLYLIKKQITEHFSKLYPDFDIVNVITSNDFNSDEPVKNKNVFKYLAIDDSIKDNLIKTHGIENDLIETLKTEEVFNNLKKQTFFKLKKKLIGNKVKIVSGWSDKGGSTQALINLTNLLNESGYDATFYGPHTWHLDKCKAELYDSKNFVVDGNDRLIMHFIAPPVRPNAGVVILACHEKNLFEVSNINKFWDVAVFLNEKHKDYHNGYNGPYEIIPNLKTQLKPSDKTGLEKIAGIIGSFDENKQTHISIERALADGCDKVYLFGEPYGVYYENMVKPLLNDKVILKGFLENKQEMYDMIGRVYHSSKSEVACLVKDECYMTNTAFYGNENTDHEVSSLTNKQIINKWIKLFND